MKIHHIGYLTQNINRTYKEFFFLKLKKKRIIKDHKFKVDICFLVGKNILIELIRPHKNNYGLINLFKRGNLAYHIGYKSNKFYYDCKRLSKKFRTIVRPTSSIAFNNKKIAFFKKKDGFIIEIIES
tara:strand:- start:88 stop:468 length:381 start_codon:yes stop_codon:yes gene_type:complete